MPSHNHNLLGEEHLPHVRRRRFVFRLVRNAVLALVLLLIVAGAILVVPSIGTFRTIYSGATAGRDDLNRAKDAADKLDFKLASSALTDAVTDFETAQDAVGRLGPIAQVPYVKDDIQAVRGLLDGGRNAAYALREAVDVGADLLSVFNSGVGAVPSLATAGQAAKPISALSADERRQLLQKMIEAPDRLGMARDSLERAIAAFDSIPRTPFTEGLLAAIQPQRDKLVQLRGYLSQDLSMLAEFPPIIGYPEPKTYLVLLLNNTEMRPGGGFVGTYGIVKLSDGAIESFMTDNVYSLDGPAEAYLKETPPEPLKKYLRTNGWFMRDANWSPDFADSAMQVERFYRLEGGAEKDLDGVIGFTPTVIARLLELTGPIKISEATFTSADVTDELEYQVERGFAKNGVPYEQRKEIVGQLGEELVKRLLSMPVSKFAQLAGIAQEAVAEKQLMAYFEDPRLQSIAVARGWSGRIPAAKGDTLMVVDANLASLKTDPAVERTISYSFKPDGQGLLARAQVTYKHTGTFNWKTTRYRTYTRFYVPLGSELVKGEGMMLDDKLNDPGRHPGTVDVGEDLGRTVFGAFISIEPGETRTLAVEYRLPQSAVAQMRSGSYRLDALKEAGMPGHKLTLDLDFGKNVVRATPPEEQSQWGDTRYRLTTDLSVDRTFTVELKP